MRVVAGAPDREAQHRSPRGLQAGDLTTDEAVADVRILVYEVSHGAVDRESAWVGRARLPPSLHAAARPWLPLYSMMAAGAAKQSAPVIAELAAHLGKLPQHAKRRVEAAFDRAGAAAPPGSARCASRGPVSEQTGPGSRPIVKGAAATAASGNSKPQNQLLLVSRSHRPTLPSPLGGEGCQVRGHTVQPRSTRHRRAPHARSAATTGQSASWRHRGGSSRQRCGEPSSPRAQPGTQLRFLAGHERRRGNLPRRGKPARGTGHRRRRRQPHRPACPIPCRTGGCRSDACG